MMVTVGNGGLPIRTDKPKPMIVIVANVAMSVLEGTAMTVILTTAATVTVNRVITIDIHDVHTATAKLTQMTAIIELWEIFIALIVLRSAKMHNGKWFTNFGLWEVRVLLLLQRI